MNNNILEFYVKMKDLMSSGLAKIAHNSQNTFTKIKGHISTAVDKTKMMTNSVNDLKNKLESVNKMRFGTIWKDEFRTASAEAKKLETQISRIEGRKRGSGIGSFLRPLIPAIGLASVLSFGTSSIQAAMDFEAKKKSFEVLTSSPSKGRQLAGELRELKQNTIMGPAVYGNAQKLLGFGIDVDKVIPDLRMLGDVSMGDANKLGRLTLAFSEVVATGKLTSQRMRQLITAGFNPLQEISRTTGKSMKTLSEEMRKGGISAKMLEHAFETATGKGGRFNDMMNQIGETTFGKMKRLEGQWANFKINAGEALLPLTNDLMNFGSHILKWIGFTTSATQALYEEKTEIGATIGVITKLNEGNEVRSKLISQLVNKYPDLFGKIDVEKVKNGELLQLLNSINDAYEKRITLATSDSMIDEYKNQGSEGLRDLIHYKMLEELARSGKDKEFWAAATPWERFSKFNWFNHSYAANKGAFDALINDAQGRIDQGKSGVAEQSNIKTGKENYYLLSDALELAKNVNGGMDKAFGKNQKAKSEFLKRIPQIAALKYIADNGEFTKFGELMNYDYSGLKSLLPVTASDIKKQKTDDGGGGGKDVATRIAGGGPRIININGVKFTDKIEIHATTMTEGESELEHRLEDMFLRILNSGASVQ